LEAALVPPLALQTLVENSVKHVAAPRRAGATIRVEARPVEGGLALAVWDDGPGVRLDAVAAGPGLDNLRGRLAALFGPAAAPPRGAPARGVGPARRGGGGARGGGRCRPGPPPGGAGTAGGGGMPGRPRAYLVDDEPLALKRLTRLLDATGRVRIVGSATDPE